MRFFILVLSVLAANFTTGQRIDKTYDLLLSFEDFKDATDEWPQRYTASELLVIQDGLYKTKNINSQKPSIISPKRNGPYKNFQIEMDLSVVSEDNENQSAGVACMIQQGGNSAVFIELNREKQYRVKISNNGRVRLLTGSAENQGWTKFSKLSGKNANRMRVNFLNGYFDLYLNDQFVETFNTFYLEKGDIGLFVSPSTEAEFDNISIKSFTQPLITTEPTTTTPPQNTSNETDDTEDSPSSVLTTGGSSPSTPDAAVNDVETSTPERTAVGSNQSQSKTEGDDETITQIAAIFKKTIDKQNQEITELKAQVLLLQEKLEKSTGSSEEVELYEQENERLRNKLNLANGRIAELEAEIDQLKTVQKAFTDEAENKDLVLELTKLIAQLKSENSELKDKVTQLQLENIKNN